MPMKTIRRWMGLLLALVAGCGIAAARAQEEPAWETLRGCLLYRHSSNDGDSFRITHLGRTVLIRLYLVDAPETDARFPDRVREQAEYFGITPEQALQVGEQATRFMEQTLNKAFEVRTQWEDAMGAATVPRYFGVVIVNGRDFAELLVENGLARIYGKPTGADARARFARLRKLEADARKHRRGAWALSSDPTAGRRPNRPQ
jgi:endonuclease YncB( thermonuclease family)